jgi:hypothetical protein
VLRAKAAQHDRKKALSRYVAILKEEMAQTNTLAD